MYTATSSFGRTALRRYIATITASVILVGFWTASAIAYERYDQGCDGAACHGAFNSGTYTSKTDAVSWGKDLMDGHRDFISGGGSCDVCHSGADRTPVLTNLADSAEKPLGCIGCHGRVGDESGICAFNLPDNDGEHCGSAAGLRNVHNTAGVTVCFACHTNDNGAVLVGEDELPFNYGLTNIGLTSPCLNENQFGVTGLDNDGDGAVDAADTDCSPSNPTPHDLDGDGKADLLWSNISNGENALWVMDGGTRSANLSVPSAGDPDWQIVADGDFNGDDIADIMWRNTSTGKPASGQLVYWQMDVATRTSHSIVDTVTDLNWQIVGDGDMNGDGTDDLLWRHAISGTNVYWQINGGARASQANLITVADLNWKVVGNADYDGDNDADVLWRHAINGQVVFWEMTANIRNSQNIVGIVNNVDWVIVGDGDFNGDSTDDILWRNTSTGANALWQMNGGSMALNLAVPQVSDTTWQIKGDGDHNGDGMADIAWRNSGNGAVVVWEMDGATRMSNVLVETASNTAWDIVNLN